MAKVTISRLLEISKVLSTEAGKQLKDTLEYLSTFTEVTVRNLKNGLTFYDNFACEAKLVAVRHGVEITVGGIGRNQGNISQVMITKVIDDVYYKIDSFGWKYASDGQLVITVEFVGSPPSTQQISIELLILFR